MAIRTKTVEYAFPHWTGSSITKDNAFTSSAITIYIPETGSRKIISAFLYLFARDNVDIVSGVSPTDTQIGVRLGSTQSVQSVGTAFWDDTLEQVGQGMYSNVTSLFDNVFTGNVTASTAQSLWWAETSSYGNIASKMTITYAYDDTNTVKKLKTIAIPLQSHTGSLSETLSYIDTIPVLNTFCPEVGKVFKSIWIEAEGNSGATGLLAFQNGLKIGSNNVWYSNYSAMGGNSSTYLHFIYVPNTFDSSSEQTLFAIISGSSTVGFNNFCPTLYATYEYNAAQTSRSLVSIQLPWEMPSQIREQTTSFPTSFYRDIIFVGENITQSICASRMYYSVNTTPSSVYFWSENQTPILYTVAAGAPTCGGMALQHRFDSSAPYGQGSVVQKGQSHLLYYLSNTGTNGLFNVNGISFINYVCTTPTIGDDILPTTTHYMLSTNLANTSLITADYFSPTISESYYWLNGIGYNVIVADQSPGGGYNINVEITGSDGVPIFHGWDDAYADTKLSDGEAGHQIVNCSARGVYKLYPQYPKNDLINISSPRRTVISSPNSIRATAKFVLTKHSITSSISGSVTGYSGDGSGIVVQAFQSGSDDYILQTTTTTGGQFQMVWYDNTIPLYVSAYQNNNRVGRSGFYTASLMY